VGGARGRYSRKRGGRLCGESSVIERGPSLLEGMDQILNCLGFSDRLYWNVHPKSPLDAQYQFGAGKTVDPEIALDATGWLDLDEMTALRVQLLDKIVHERDQVTAKLDIGQCSIHKICIDRAIYLALIKINAGTKRGGVLTGSDPGQ
jgi:hypothetical protein